MNWILLSSNSSFATSNKLCSKRKGIGTRSYYEFSLPSGCAARENCWLQFKAPEDKVRILVDEKHLVDLSQNDQYLSNEFFLLPLPKDDIKKIVITAEDNNQDLKSPNSFCINIGKHEDLRWANSRSWFFHTGSNLFSAYFLLIISFFLIFSFWLRKSGIGLSLLAYSLVSFFYLISFSEYPRALLDPVLATGAFHFPLRLLQDLSLVIVFHNFYQKEDSKNIIKKITWIYLIVIGLYLLLLSVGVRDYIYYSRIIMIMAPLVAAPMAIGTWFAFKLKDEVERKVLIPISILLLLFQLNDLFVFWRILDSYFTVKLYIPFIVGMLLFLYFRRIHDEVIDSKTSLERQRIFKEFIHDVKSPLAVLRIFLAGTQKSGEREKIVEAALNRIEGMVSYVDNPNKEDFNEKISVNKCILELIAQKKIEYDQFKISFDNEIEVFTYADKSKLLRLFSNIINNAYEASTSGSRTLLISFVLGEENLRVQFTDKGVGIPNNIKNKLLKEEISTKENGKGIGLKSAYSYVNSIGGSLDITSKTGFGTTVEITLNTVPGNVTIEDVDAETSKNRTNNSKSLDFVLIDDDKYIRLSWEYFARNSKKEILTFPTIESFILASEKIPSECPIYLDLNLNGVKSTDYLQRLHELGFTNIILATGEDLSQFKLPKYVQNVTGKLPPLQ